MKIHENDQNGVVVLDVMGDMHGGPENVRLIELLERAGAEGKLDAVLNLAKVGYIASNGFGCLIRARGRYAVFGGAMRFCSPNRRVLSVLTVTRLDMVFDVYDDCRRALEAIEEERRLQST